MIHRDEMLWSGYQSGKKQRANSCCDAFNFMCCQHFKVGWGPAWESGDASPHPVSKLQLSATPQPLARRPLLASECSTFFFFFIPCFLCLLYKTRVSCKGKKSGGEWEKGSWASLRCTDLLPLRERNHQLSGSEPPCCPQRGAGAHITTLIPEKSYRDCHCPSGHTHSAGALHRATEPCSQPLQEGGILIPILYYISFIPGGQRGAVS